MLFTLCCLASTIITGAAEEAAPVPFPAVCAVPMPESQVAFEVAGGVRAAYHYGPATFKPYVFPLIGPAGKRLTRLTHPHDPHGHRHHLGVWVAHKSVNRTDFWDEGKGPRIAHNRIEKIGDGADSATLAVLNDWVDADGQTLMRRAVVWAAAPVGISGVKITLQVGSDPSGRVETQVQLLNLPEVSQ